MTSTCPPCDTMEASGGHSRLKWLAVGTALAAGAVIAAPYVLPAIGIGEGAEIVGIMSGFHANAANVGEGLAGLLNTGFTKIPLIGKALAAGDLTTALISGTLGIGGMLLGRYIDKREDGSHHIRWGKVLATSALVASALIALPTMLTGITAGITFLAARIDSGLASKALSFLTKTIGYANSPSLASASLSLGAIALPHLMTCGAGALPAVLSSCMHNYSSREHVPGPVEAAGTTRLPGDVSPIVASVRLEQPTRAFEEARGVLILRHAENGVPVTPEEIRETHTKKVHFLLVDSSLKDFHHLHPVPTGTAGEYAFSFTPHTSNPYTGWTDIVMEKDGSNLRLPASLPSLLRRAIPARVRPGNRALDADSGLTFEWKEDKPLEQGKLSDVQVTVRDAAGAVVQNLEPVLGAFAHLAGFTADGKTMIHAHPMGAAPASEQSRTNGSLHFHIQPQTAGDAQFYLQVKYNGQDITAPFGQHIAAPEQKRDENCARPWKLTTVSSAPSCMGMG